MKHQGEMKHTSIKSCKVVKSSIKHKKNKI
jgi:hypothetical protein